MVIAGTNGDGAIRVAKSSSPSLCIVLGFFTVNLCGSSLSTINIEGITQTKLETSKAGCLVLDGVIVTGGVSSTESSTVVSLTPASSKGASNTRHIKRSEEHTSELQSRGHLVCRLLLEKKKN